eukprot:365936-Chlamydomonas_euryale.AAC.3
MAPPHAATWLPRMRPHGPPACSHMAPPHAATWLPRMRPHVSPLCPKCASTYLRHPCLHTCPPTPDLPAARAQEIRNACLQLELMTELSMRPHVSVYTCKWCSFSIHLCVHTHPCPHLLLVLMLDPLSVHTRPPPHP